MQFGAVYAPGGSFRAMRSRPLSRERLERGAALRSALNIRLSRTAVYHGTSRSGQVSAAATDRGGFSMISTKEVTVRLSAGLHHQAATRFIQTANRYSSTLRVLYGGNSVNAKSLLGVVSLSIGAGAQITLTADGPDAGNALQALEQCLIAAD